MPLVMKQGETSDTSSPVILFVYTEPRVGSRPDDDPGFISDVESLTYEVTDSLGATLIATTAVDLTDAPAGHRIRLGTYAPPITLASDAVIGDYTVKWVAIRETAVDPEIIWTTTFQVLPSSELVPNGYALVSDMRAEGVPAGFCDLDIVAAIERASRYVEEVTRRFFEPRYLITQTDGVGNGIIAQLYDPIIGIEDMEITFSDFRPIARLIDRNQVRVYNRHIRPTPLLNPDDRDNPKIAILRVEHPLFNAPRFPALNRRFQTTQQNIQLTGWFGYTDPDGSPFGKVPPLLRRVVLMIAMSDLRPLWGDFKGGRRGGTTGPIKSERTRDQQLTYAEGKNAGAAGAGWITGDSSIDNILSMFIGPTPMSAV